MFKKIYEEVIESRKEGTSFIVLSAFILSFIVARALVYAINAKLIPDIYLSVHQTHVHHLNYGIFLLAISGYLSLIFHEKRFVNKLAVIYGIGLGLTFDEFSLWLFLDNNYYARISYEAIILIATILINIIYFGEIWKKIFLYLSGKN